MASGKKATIAFGVVGLALLAAGLVSASAYQSSIEHELRQEIVAERVSGRDLDGKIIPTAQIEITSRIKWPFVVEASYFVPIDLHGRHHQALYLALPWGYRRLSSKDFLPV
ncbi:hypothetical protein CQ393_11465 [Stenotrophomonas sp. MYb238]|uniref:hypothetical protein n=1 Tax=Stenotrophomonas sp. MYb238 TaxID=2040281 RepID=UPI001292B999|nr:hypothetical protein [Stenotrophomonas sp. MYb238]MQP76506.1 hypothetical protein [Stenotrophomonas sp. MYb238]